MERLKIRKELKNKKDKKQEIAPNEITQHIPQFFEMFQDGDVTDQI
jgi:hypothetical protein